MAHEISGIIMAGGKSSRMETNKAFVSYQGKTLLERVTELMNPFCNGLFISGSENEYLDSGLKVIPDIYPECGPVGGLHATLGFVDTVWNLIISIDVPEISVDFIEFLICQIGDFDCIVPVHQKGIEPLVAIYHKRTASMFESFIVKGEYKLQKIISTLNCNYIDCSSWLEKYPDLFKNINTPEQLNQ